MQNLIKGWMVVVLAGLVAGCGVHTRVYSQNRERVDQERPTGEESLKKTRKVYVLEVTKDPKIAAAKSDVQKSVESMVQPPAVPEPPKANWELAARAPEVSVVLPAEYKVQKDDTLQTISKKFYGVYSKWPKIYDANKDKIPDPNRIKAGITITIPKE